MEEKELKDLIWEKIRTDKVLMQFTDETDLKFLKQHFEAIPEVLADIIDDVANPKNITEAHLIYVRNRHESRFFEKWLFATNTSFSRTDIEEFIEILDIFIELELQGLEHDLLGITIQEIEFNDQPDDEFIEQESLKLGLDEKSRKMFCEGKLSIRDLLEIQPKSILGEFPITLG